MATRGDLVGRLRALSERHTPGRVLVVVRDEVTARWVSSLLAERGATLGVRVAGLETLLAAAMLELFGEPIRPARALALVRAALLEDPDGRFAAIAEQPSYQREVLRVFVELERGLGGASVQTVRPAEPDGRDAVMLAAFERFREAAADERGWWRGPAPQRVVAGWRRVSFLRRRAAAVGLGFLPGITAQWELQLLEQLGFDRWGSMLELDGERGGLGQRLSCAGPEAEIAAIARLLRSEPQRPAVVLAPSDAVPRWVARLRHRDVPIRAWVERRAASTAAAGAVRALLRVLAEPTAVRRGDLEAILFGPAMRAWASVAEQLGIDYPHSPHPGDVASAWERQRASSFALAGLAGRLHAAGDAEAEALAERARRYGWPASELERRGARARAAHRLLAGAVERLDAVARDGGAPPLHELLDDWDLLGRAAVHGVAGPEMTAARVVVELCARASEAGVETDSQPDRFAVLAMDLDHALALASAGSWEQSRAIQGGGAPVWVLPYASVGALACLASGPEPTLGRSPWLPERLFLTGLDAHPQPPVHHGPVSDAVRERLGLVVDRSRFALELRTLDQLVASAEQVVGSWRHRDGAGARRPPGPWIAGLRDPERGERAVGVDAIALPTGGEPPSAPLEQELIDWARDPLLRRRVEAIRSHEAEQAGPHTGLLGVRVEPRLPYSASALQRYAQLPYQYFIERVIGLRERQAAGSSDASLLASEQGQVVHRALEAALAARLAGSDGWLELASVSEELLAEALSALAEGYRKRAEHGQAEAIWASERDRWAVELSLWWQRWHERLRASWGGSDDAGRSGSRRRPEPEQLVPGVFLVAAEWSPASGDPPGFALDLLGMRTIPFAGAVDRIELDPARGRLVVVDYKTGRPRWPRQIAAELRAGVHLQLPLYALAVQQVASAQPERLRLPGPLPVGALRLEYLQRPAPRGGRLGAPEARGFAPGDPLGVDASGRTWTIIEAAASFCVAFVAGIEAGQFPIVARAPRTTRRFGAAGRIAELARVIPDAEQRRTSLPPALEPLPDPRLAREVVQ